MYKVKPSDLKGRIQDFPIEVVQKMVERQYEQICKYDVSVFQSDQYKGKFNGGFTWNETVEGDNFWRQVISYNNFDLFFEKYPRETTYANPDCHYYIKKTSETKINDIISKLKSLGGKSIYKDRAIYDIYYIDPVNKNIERCYNDSIIAHLIKTFYTETFVDTVYEYTMDEIAEKLGVDVKQLKIKK